MKKTRRRCDRASKISVLAELESGKLLAQIAREHNIHRRYLGNEEFLQADLTDADRRSE